jgi:hypothetical protein
VTEIEWLASADPAPMVLHLPRQKERRDLKLFAVACVRRWLHLISDSRLTHGIVMAEYFADKPLKTGGHDSIGDVYQALAAIRDAEGRDSVGYLLSSAIHDTICSYHGNSEWQPHTKCARVAGLTGGDAEAESAWQTGILRCVVGNPFRTVTLPDALAEPMIRSLAQTANRRRDKSTGLLDPERVGVLGDAIEEVGEGGDILAHLRSAGQHSHGCWVVDLLRKKKRR